MAKNNTYSTENVSDWDGSLANYVGTLLLQALVLVISAGIGFFVATYKLINNGTPWMEDVKNPLALLLLFAGAMIIGVGFCWACVFGVKYELKHSIICGQRLQFKANSLNLLFTTIKWTFLTVITLGIYALWIPVKVRQWILRNTVSSPEENAGEITYLAVDDEGNCEPFNYA